MRYFWIIALTLIALGVTLACGIATAMEPSLIPATDELNMDNVGHKLGWAVIAFGLMLAILWALSMPKVRDLVFPSLETAIEVCKKVRAHAAYGIPLKGKGP